MEVSDSCFITNLDWDPCYLHELFREDFFEFTELWKSNVEDSDLIKEMNKLEKYSPITEDISLDDNQLCTAIAKIEHE